MSKTSSKNGMRIISSIRNIWWASSCISSPSASICNKISKFTAPTKFTHYFMDFKKS